MLFVPVFSVCGKTTDFPSINILEGLGGGFVHILLMLRRFWVPANCRARTLTADNRFRLATAAGLA